MILQFTQATKDAIVWLSANFTALKKALVDIQRIAKKVDGFSVTGAAKFSNQPDSLSLAVSGPTGGKQSADFRFLVPLLLTQTGGVSGTNASASCTFTYSIFHAINDPSKTTALSTAVALTGHGNGWRDLQLALTAGTYGYGYRNASGTWVLIFADEYPTDEQHCS